MMNDFDISLIGDEDLKKAIAGMNYKTQHIELKKILRDVGQKVIVKRLRSDSPPSNRLKKSFGVITGKSKNVATVFVGPRVPTRFGKRTSTNQGYLANIIEFNKFKPRYPGKDRFTGEQRKRPKTPQGIRQHSGVFPWRPFIKQSLMMSIREAEKYEATAVRKILEKEWNKYKRLRA